MWMGLPGKWDSQLVSEGTGIRRGVWAPGETGRAPDRDVRREAFGTLESIEARSNPA